MLTKEQLCNNVNPPGDADTTYHTLHELEELLVSILPPEKHMYHDANPAGDFGDIYYAMHKLRKLVYDFKWKEQLHYNAGPVLESGDLQ